MATRRWRRIGLTVALLAGTATLALTPTAASACSFAFVNELTLSDNPTAGGTLTITGRGFTSIEGYLSGSCGGDYEFVPAPPLTLKVAFTTLSGPRAVAVTATPTGPRIPDDEWDVGDDDLHTFTVEVPIPADATAVEVTNEDGFSAPVDADIAGATATTVPTTVPATTPAAPAAAVAGDPSFTG